MQSYIPPFLCLACSLKRMFRMIVLGCLFVVDCAITFAWPKRRSSHSVLHEQKHIISYCAGA